MLRKRFFLGFGVLLAAGVIVVAAQRQSNKPKATDTTAAPKATAQPRSAAKKTQGKAPARTAQQAPNAQHTSQAPVSGKAQTAKAPAPMTASKSTPTKLDKPADTKLAKPEKPADPKLARAKTAPSTTPPSPTLLTAVQQKLQQNTNLAAKVASRLPQGTDLMGAAAGFNNLGQLVAAVNVSNNLQVSFAELKAKLMTGMSLGQAIQAVRPLTASPTIEAQRAEYDARGLIASEQPPQTASSGPITTPTTTTTMPQKTKAKVKNSVQ